MYSFLHMNNLIHSKLLVHNTIYFICSFYNLLVKVLGAVLYVKFSIFFFFLQFFRTLGLYNRQIYKLYSSCFLPDFNLFTLARSRFIAKQMPETKPKLQNNISLKKEMSS